MNAPPATPVLRYDAAEGEAVNAALAAFQSGRAVEAIPMFRRLAEWNPDVVEAHLLLALALEAGGPPDIPECYAHYERALALAPASFEVAFNYGKALLHSTREREAEQMLRRALELQPDHARALERLATALIEQARFDEALPLLERAATLAPEFGEAIVERDRLRAALAAKDGRRAIARFPRSTKEFANLERLIDQYVLCELGGGVPILHPQTRTFTMGSCFARNIAWALEGFGMAADHVLQPEEINNTYANRLLLEWLVEGPGEATAGFASTFGEGYRERFAELLQRSDVYILSLGVAPAFFDRATGAFVPTFGSNLNTALLLRSYDFRTTTVAENVANLERIVALVRRINPALRIVITLSPVPLRATFERGSAVIADCISKSTLRVAAHEFGSSPAGRDVIYWPSFEIVRWLGSHVDRAFFGSDDESPLHPDDEIIRLIMRKFLELFGDADVRRAVAAAAPGRP
jgi:Tfp pilus assembly protein PilF